MTQAPSIVCCRETTSAIPPCFESRFRGVKLANRRFDAMRANRSHVMKIAGFLRIDSCESIRANRPDSRCESPGHLGSIDEEIGCDTTPLASPIKEGYLIRGLLFVVSNQFRPVL